MKCPNCNKEVDNGLMNWVNHQNECDHSASKSTPEDYIGFDKKQEDITLYVGAKSIDQFKEALEQDFSLYEDPGYRETKEALEEELKRLRNGSTKM